jgi:hypothetical protein
MRIPVKRLFSRVSGNRRGRRLSAIRHPLSALVRELRRVLPPARVAAQGHP